MTLFVTLLVIVLLFIALILYLRQKSADQQQYLEQTGNLTAQINQTLLMSKAEPQLALELALQLPEGEAQQLALQLVASELYVAGHKAQATAIYQQLPPHAREYVLNTLIETLLDSQDTQACLELLEHWGESLPSWPLLQVPILQARGEQARALALIGELGDPKNPAAHERQSIGNLLMLSRLQFQAGMQDAALISLEQAWASFQQPGQERYHTVLRSLFDAFATQGHAERILAHSAELPAEEQVQALIALFDAGQVEPAFSLLADNGTLYSSTYSDLMDSALKRQPTETALRLLDLTPEMHQHSLLLQLLNHLAAQGQTAEAEALLQARASHESQRPGLMLNLCDELHQAQPQWTTALLTQALQLIDGYRNEHEFYNSLRMQALQTQLLMQSHLPAHRRDSWLVRSSIEEMHRLRQQMPGDEQLLHLCDQAKLLHALDQTAQARSLLEQAVQLLDGEPLPDVDEMDARFYLEDIASAYLSIDDVQQAQALQDRLNAEDSGSRILEEELLLNHIQHQRYAQAIEGLNLGILLSDKKPLSLLYQALEDLQQRAPERAGELKQQLMARIANGQIWLSSQTN